MSIKRYFLGGTRGLVLMLSLVTILSYFNRIFLVAEMLVSLRPIYSMMACILVVITLIVHQRALMFVSLLLLSLNLHGVVGYWGFGQHALTVDNNIRILVYNVDKNSLPYIDHAYIEDLLIDSQPEIVVLLEINRTEAEFLQTKMNEKYPYSYIQHDVEFDGTLILSKLTITKTEVLTLGLGRKVASIYLLLSGNQIQLIAPHPTNALFNFAERNSQLKAIADYAGTVDMPLIIAGDLNVTMWSQWYLDIERAGVSNVREGQGILPTWQTPIPFLKLPLDHILVSQHFKKIRTVIIPNLPSDHSALLSDLIIK